MLSQAIEVRLAVHDDAIGQLALAVAVALGQREAVVQPEQVETAVLRAVLHDEDDVVEAVDHVVGQQIQLVDHQGLERRAHPCRSSGVLDLAHLG